MAKGKARKKTTLKDPFKELVSICIGILAGTLIFSHNWTMPSETLIEFQALLLPFTLSFFFYYLAQRYMAERLRCNMSYNLWIPGIVFSLMLMLVGIKLFLIGGIIISAYKFGRFGMKDRLPSIQEIGFISVAGPLMNMIVVAIFNVLTYYIGSNPFFADMIFLNSWMAFFNLIPIKDLDGGKVMFWYPMFWMILMFFAILLITPSNMLSFFT